MMLLRCVHNFVQQLIIYYFFNATHTSIVDKNLSLLLPKKKKTSMVDRTTTRIKNVLLRDDEKFVHAEFSFLLLRFDITLAPEAILRLKKIQQGTFGDGIKYIISILG